MEKGPSEYAEYWTSEYNEIMHFKHAKEFGYSTLPEYSQAALEFANEENKEYWQFIGRNGATYKYDTQSKRFIAISNKGRIITFFKASKRYVKNEYKKHGTKKIQGDFD